MTDATPASENNTEIFNAEKPSKLKTAFQLAGAFASGLVGDNVNFGWNQAGITYDYLKAKIQSKGTAPSAPAAA